MQMLHRHYVEIMKNAGKNVLPPVAFQIQGVVNWVYSADDEAIDVRNKIYAVAPPFESIWMEFSNSQIKLGAPEFKTYGALIVSESKDDGWSMRLRHYGERPGKCIWIANTVFDIEHDGELVGSNADEIPATFEFATTRSQESRDAVGPFVMQLSQIYLAAISLMHIKGIIKVPVALPPRLRAARLKKGIPDIQFKTLAIEPLRQRMQKQYEDNPNGPSSLQLAFHLVRGHFKDFREKGLFGNPNLRGVYWWDAQARGDKANGQIIKDYEVKV